MVVAFMELKKEFPKITYFVESREQALAAKQRGECRGRGEYLQKNITDDDTLALLRETHGAVSVALNREEADDAAMIDTLQALNNHGVPVSVWANLQDGDGYWIHAGNVEKARMHIDKMMNRLEQHGVRVANIGLDLELPGSLVFSGRNPVMEYLRVQPFRFSQDAAHDQLSGFVEEILDDGRFGVQTYEIPMLGDWRLARRLLGIPQAPELEHSRYERVGMVYTSVKPPLISPRTFIQRYSAGKKRTPALGIVSASTENPGRDIHFSRLLTDQELHRDVAAALEVSPSKLFVFALNGTQVIERVRRAVNKVL